jgi:hypothetical protein
MLKLSVEAAPESNLAAAALASNYPYKSIVYGQDHGSVIPCVKNVCYEPIKDPAGLEDFLNNL